MPSEDNVGAIHRKQPDLGWVVVPMEEQHVDRSRQLWIERFGTKEEDMDEWFSETLKEGTPTEGFVAVSGGYVLGFGMATFAPPDYVNEYVGMDVFDKELPETTGILHILCVDEDYGGRGIGSELAKARLRWLSVEGADAAIGISWNREEHQDSRPIFEKFDFEESAVVEEYYDKTHGRAPCPDCDGTCMCTATIYRREL